MAESPPPITRVSLPAKSGASHTAHHATPLLRSASSPGIPSIRGCAPIARITVFARSQRSPTRSRCSPPRSVDERHLLDVFAEVAGAEAFGLIAQVAGELRSEHALRVAREVLDVGRLLEQAARPQTFDHPRRELRPRRVERRGVGSRAAADDDHGLDAIGFGSSGCDGGRDGDWRGRPLGSVREAAKAFVWL